MEGDTLALNETSSGSVEMDEHEFFGSGEMRQTKDSEEDTHTELDLEEETSDPQVGMVFESSDQLYSYWSKYGNQKGFPVKKRSSRKGDSGEIRWLLFSCGRSGTTKSTSRNVLKKRPTTKTNCKAKIRAALDHDRKWRVTSLVLEHNHDLSPGKSRFYKKNRVLKPFVKRRLEMNDKAGIRPNKSYGSFVVEAHGHDNVPFLEKD